MSTIVCEVCEIVNKHPILLFSKNLLFFSILRKEQDEKNKYDLLLALVLLYSIFHLIAYIIIPFSFFGASRSFFYAETKPAAIYFNAGERFHFILLNIFSYYFVRSSISRRGYFFCFIFFDQREHLIIRYRPFSSRHSHSLGLSAKRSKKTKKKTKRRMQIFSLYAFGIEIYAFLSLDLIKGGRKHASRKLTIVLPNCSIII